MTRRTHRAIGDIRALVDEALAVGREVWPPARPPCAEEEAGVSRPRHVLLAPNLEKHLNRLCTRGSNAVEIAGLLELCSEGIYKEATALQQLHPGALVEHTQALCGYIGFLADTLRDMGERIENEASQANDVVGMMTEGGAQ
jgi:hypothetical protein